MADGSAPRDDSGWRDEAFDAVFGTLADEHRRQVLRYFQTTGGDVAPVEELIEYTVEQEDETATRDDLAVQFHHETLPKLDDVGAVEYDHDNQTVQYCESPLLEEVLTVLVESGML